MLVMMLHVQHVDALSMCYSEAYTVYWVCYTKHRIVKRVITKPTRTQAAGCLRCYVRESFILGFTFRDCSLQLPYQHRRTVSIALLKHEEESCHSTHHD